MQQRDPWQAPTPYVSTWELVYVSPGTEPPSTGRPDGCRVSGWAMTDDASCPAGMVAYRRRVMRRVEAR